MKKKGTRAERELMHLFLEAGWYAVRAAGSGSMPVPLPDLVVGNGKRYLAIECKSLKKKSKYLSEEDIRQLKIFSKGFGAEPWLAIRFNNVPWYFLPLKKLEKSSGNNYVITMESARKKGLKLNELIST